MANMITGMFDVAAALKPGTEKDRALIRIERLQSSDKSLEIQLLHLRAQEQSVAADLEAAKREVNRNLEKSSFKLMGS